MKRLALTIALMVLPATSVVSQELTVMEADRVANAASLLIDATATLDDSTVKVAPDTAEAFGLGLRRDGILVVPQENLQEDAIRSQTGAGFAYLFFSSSFQLLVGDEVVDNDKIHHLTIMPQQNAIEVSCVLLAARQVGDDDRRMYVYGTQQEPLLESPFGKADDNAAEDTISLAVKDPQANRGKLVVTLFGKYSSTLDIQYTQ